MKTCTWIVAMAFAAAFMCAGSTWAADTGTVKADNKAAFEAVAAAVRQQLEPGGRWQYASKLEKEQVSQHLDDMQALFDQFGTVAQMSDTAKARLFNDQETVNEILTKRDDQHMVCTEEMPTGSHIPKRICRTYGEIRREQNNARWGLDTLQNRNGNRGTAGDNGLKPPGGH